MTDMKCPFCQQELDYLAEDIYGGMYCPNCKNHDLFGNKKMWQELIRTRKALDVAVKALEDLDKVLQEKAEYSAQEGIPDNPDLYAWAVRIKPALLEIKQITETKDLK